MGSPTKHTGHWWLPDEPEVKYWGTLTLKNPQRLKLRLTHPAQTDYGAAIRERFERGPRLLLGVTVEGEHITLIDCLARAFAQRELLSWEVQPHSALVGTHLRRPSDLATRELHVILTELPSWFRYTSARDLPDDLRAKYRIKASELRLGKFGPFSISVIRTATWGSDSPTLTLRQEAIVRISAKKKQSLTSIWSVIEGLRSFFALVTSQQVQVEEVACGMTLYHLKGSKAYKPKYPLLTIVGPFLGPSRPEKNPSADGPLLDSRLFGKKLRKYVPRWLENQETLKPVYDLYWQTAHTGAQKSEFRFLLLAQALETYHRRMFRGNVLPKSEWRAKRKAILASVPAEFREWLGGKIAFANEFTFAERIRVTCDRVWGLIGDKIEVEPETLVRLVKDARNYLTHYSIESQDRRPASADVTNAGNWITLVLELNLLMDLGLSEDELAQIVSWNSAFRFSYYGAWREMQLDAP